MIHFLFNPAKNHPDEVKAIIKKEILMRRVIMEGTLSPEKKYEIEHKPAPCYLCHEPACGSWCRYYAYMRAYLAKKQRAINAGEFDRN